MATTRLMPLHVGKGRDVSTAIADIIDYVKNPQRHTDYGCGVSSFKVAIYKSDRTWPGCR